MKVSRPVVRSSPFSVWKKKSSRSFCVDTERACVRSELYNLCICVCARVSAFICDFSRGLLIEQRTSLVRTRA